MQVMRAALERSDVEVVAYNDPFVDPEVSTSFRHTAFLRNRFMRLTKWI